MQDIGKKSAGNNELHNESTVLVSTNVGSLQSDAPKASNSWLNISLDMS